MSSESPSAHALSEASRDRSRFSGHGKSLGAAGYREPGPAHAHNSTFLTQPGQNVVINPPQGAAFQPFRIGATWDNTRLKNAGFFSRFLGKTLRHGVDLDLGCLYELSNGTRGALQAFGDKFGSFDAPPYIHLSGDERTGDSAGEDEILYINGAQWPTIKRMIVYLYIYAGADRWSRITPQVVVDVPGEKDLYVTLATHRDDMPLCVVGGLENLRGAIRLTNHSEYFPGHAEMDRAFGFGLEWADGQKER